MEGQGVGIHNINKIMEAEMSLYIQEKSLRLSLAVVKAVVVREKGKLRPDYRGIYVYLVIPKVLTPSMETGAGRSFTSLLPSRQGVNT